MTDEPNSSPPSADDSSPEGADALGGRRAPSARATNDKDPSPGYESADAGDLPLPPHDSAPRPTPESQAALTGKAPSGSSTSGTTVPAAAGKGAAATPPPNETPEEKIARLKRIVEEAKARKAQQGGGAEGTPPAAAEPPGGASPPIGDPTRHPSSSDLEKAARIAEAKARVAAAKQTAAGEKAAPSPAVSGTAAAVSGGGTAAPKAPVKKKEEGPKPTDAADHPVVKKLREQLPGAVLEAFTFLGQVSVQVAPTRIVDVCRLLKNDAETPFDYLSDLTCVHFPERADAPFEMVYNLYSIKVNARVRLKAATNEADGIESVTGVWPAANWMEREVYDLFGVRFVNHPDLRRMLLPPDWEGHPLRKDYPLEFMENRWTTQHLPEFTEVQKEQLEQRRAYGLEILSTPDERRVREFFRAGKEVMPLDRK